MKKTIYIIIGLAIAITAAIMIYFLFFAEKTAPQDTPPIQITTGELPIEEIRNIPGATQLSSTNTLLQSTEAFDLIYFDFGPDDKSFLIDIKSSDVETARQTAEVAFLQSLKITEGQACQLNVSLRVSKDANDSLSGQEFGLSFCPNGRPFK